MEEMKQDEAAADSAPGTGVLEGLLLTVRVELGARRLTLDDLANLRAGQIIELGCRATDPVDLVTENGTVARGELVDVEGRLGVRITRVLVKTFTKRCAGRAVAARGERRRGWISS